MKAEEVLDLIEEGRFLDSVVDIVWRDMQKTKKQLARKTQSCLLHGCCTTGTGVNSDGQKRACLNMRTYTTC